MSPQPPHMPLGTCFVAAILALHLCNNISPHWDMLQTPSISSPLRSEYVAFSSGGQVPLMA
eukprot:11015765-Prorocentrum_lima.AAC.1